ncbi:MAG: glycosyltransferase family 9 protein [Ignavibacteriaceae bacterium]|jgi:heptosyltransferase III|nr:glycosyltransferase family 9 protein [Ignavibacteriaceae bacterium]
MKIEDKEIKKILCVKPRGIGDIILSTIVLENLKIAFPHSEIHYLTEEFAKRAVENNPYVSKILTFKKKDFVLSIIRKIRKERYDLVFDFWSNPKTAQITFLSGARYRVGFEKRGRKYAYNFIGKNGTMGKHAAEDNLVLLKTLAIPVISKRIIYQTTDEEKDFANKFLEKINHHYELKLIGLIPSGGWESKRCDVSKWIEICNEIKKSCNVKFLILWGPGDEKDAKEIQAGLNPNPEIIPESKFGELSALIEKCDLIIANDSGPMHAAAALGKPTIGIFGPTDPEAHRPYSENSSFVIHSELHCIICTKLVCPYQHECMLELPMKNVMLEINKLIKI